MKYINDILLKANMEDSKPVATPIATVPPLSIHGELLRDPTEYRMLIGSLQYLGLTRPDIAFTVNKLAQYMQRPTEEHMQALRRLLRYLSGTSHMGLIIHKNSPMHLHAYSDAIGHEIRMTTSPQLLTLYTWVKIQSLGHQGNNVQEHDPLLRLNIRPWLTQLLKYYGSKICSRNSVTPFLAHQWYFVTMPVPHM